MTNGIYSTLRFVNENGLRKAWWEFEERNNLRACSEGINGAINQNTIEKNVGA